MQIADVTQEKEELRSEVETLRAQLEEAILELFRLKTNNAKKFEKIGRLTNKMIEVTTELDPISTNVDYWRTENKQAN